MNTPPSTAPLNLSTTAQTAVLPPPPAGHHQSFWLWVMCLTGVDYFSTLGYQPSIAYVNAGLLAPLATVLLVLITLFGAYPVYAYVARCSAEGERELARRRQHDCITDARRATGSETEPASRLRRGVEQA